MAENIVANMFGVTPEQVRARSMGNLQSESMQYAQLDPMQRAHMGIYQGAGMLAGQGARAMGGELPEERMAAIRQQAIQGLNPDDPKSIWESAKRLHEAGDPQGAMVMAQNARQLQAELSKQNLEAAQAAKALREPEGKPLTEEVGVTGRPEMRQKMERQPNGSWIPVGPPYRAGKGDGEGGRSERPLPIGVFKQKGEWEDSLNTSSQIERDTKAWADKIKEGKLNLGLLSNVGGKLSVKAGVGGKDAVELANFATYIERLRNDQMLLAKGVQTEGDAIRELNGIVLSISDPKYVQTRMEVLGKNAAEKSRKTEMQLNGINKHYKFEDYDINEFKAKSSPYAMQEQPQAQPKAGGKYQEGQTATNPATGEKVIYRGGSWQKQ